MKRLVQRMLTMLLVLLLPALALCEEITPEPLEYAPTITPEPLGSSEVTLHVAGGMSSAYDAFRQMYPHIGIETTEDDYFSANAIIGSLMTRDATYDIMKVSTSSVDVAQIIDRGYALPMEDSEIIADYVNSLYPALRDMVTRDGKVYAVPLFLHCQEGGYVPQSFVELGLEVPTTWQELAALINAWPDQPDEVREEYEINQWTMNYREWFLRRVTERYVTHMEATGQELHFDTPLYRELMSLVDTMTTENDTDEELEVNYLMGNGYIEPIQMGYTWDTPLLDLAMEGRVTHSIYVSMVLLNPYTQHAEEAQRCIEVMIGRISAPVRQTMVDAAYLTPMEDPDYPQRVADWEAERERLETRLAECDEADRFDVQEELRWHEEYKASLDASKWLITAESIPAYAKVFETLYFPRPSVLDAKDEHDAYARSIAHTLEARYIAGQIGMDDFIREMESRMQMVLKERGN